ncbi:hypothetical protein JB92DRAFT_2914025 [Gautieria morchelliformis]|nr:hypothetical protein JB92DRAFT_2914025 [Gautieria morchelliformis]
MAAARVHVVRVHCSLFSQTVSGLATSRGATRLPFFSPEAFFLFEACGTHSDGLHSTFDLSNVSTELNELGISSSLTHLLRSGCQARRKYMDEETGQMLGD